MFDRDFKSFLRFVNSFGDVTITSEELQILIYLERKTVNECVLYRATAPLTRGNPLEMVMHLLPRVWQWSCLFLFKRLSSVPTGDRTPISRMQG